MKHYKEKCKECNGSGNITVHNGCKPKGDFLIECHLCDGTGFIDWKCKGVKTKNGLMDLWLNFMMECVLKKMEVGLKFFEYHEIL